MENRTSVAEMVTQYILALKRRIENKSTEHIFADPAFQEAMEQAQDKLAVTPDMALRLSRAFNTTPELWLNLQQSYELWHAAHDSTTWKKVKPVVPAIMDSHA